MGLKTVTYLSRLLDDKKINDAEWQLKLQERIKRKKKLRFVICIAIVFISVSTLVESLSSCNLEDVQRILISDPVDTASEDRSIVQICREIQKPLENGVRSSKDTEASEPTHVHESIHTCTSQHLFESLLTIYSSAVLSRTLSKLGMNMSYYSHNCDRFRLGLNDEVRTVQMTMPNDLPHIEEVATYFSKRTSLDTLVNKCYSFLQNYEREQFNLPLFKPEFMEDEETKLFIKFMTKNLLRASNYSFGGLNKESKEEEAVVFQRKLLANSDTDAPNHDGENVVVIYLDAYDIRAVPLHYYAVYIQRSATNINILQPKIDEKEEEKKKLISAHANLLLSYISDLSPRAKVSTYEIGSYEAIRSILSARTLICPPGLDCIFPAIARNAELNDRQLTILVDNGESSYLSLNKLPQDLLKHMKKLPSYITKDIKFMGKKKEGESRKLHPESLSFLKHPPANRAMCPIVRGRYGSWMKDDKFAAQLQYKTPVDHIFGFADTRYSPTKHRPYRSPTTYRWIEDGSLSTCQVKLLKLESFCQIMLQLSIGRLFFVGDFVGMNQAYSLWKILGNEDSPKPIHEREPGWERDIICPDGQEIQILYTRNDIMEENDKVVDLPNDVSNCNGYLYCYKWTESYLEYYKRQEASDAGVQKTVLITSFGPHFYHEKGFRKKMNQFLETVEVVLKERLTKDYIFYRNISPGHSLCNRKEARVPFKTFDEYRPTITELYSWDLHDGFNDIAEQMIGEFNEAHGYFQTHLAPINILDVYPMTILRRDGHIGGADCDKCSIANDCFHYSLPGPSDWWNHLLFSNLYDFAAIQRDDFSI